MALRQSSQRARRAPAGLVVALADRARCTTAVNAALEHLEADPLASAGHFRGDLLRRLMELPASHWAREPAQYARYRAVLRAAALLRRALPEAERRAFWSELPPLPPSTGASAETSAEASAGEVS